MLCPLCSYNKKKKGKFIFKIIHVRYVYNVQCTYVLKFMASVLLLRKIWSGTGERNIKSEQFELLKRNEEI